MFYYDLILQGEEATEEFARDVAMCGAALSESELIDEGHLPYVRYVDTVNGIDIWYDFGADYYCFSPAED